ncbi:flagellar hook-length control protein FliK [Craterilacuibacter sp.]|uniref:flagellar hook-length control protein FliK n=1 Tax=Craterilacuibacter sp. TaxID=2870909 RepID=UPI003F2DACC4
MISNIGQQAGAGLAQLATVDNARFLKDAGRGLIAVDKAPAKAPALVLGETVQARVVERQAGNKLVALIKNGLFTLSLPPGVAAKGESLTLKVAALQPALTFMLAADAAEPEQNSSVAVKLSSATRYLSDLLRAAPQATGKAATLLDPEAPLAERAASLSQAVKQSGVFYESQQKAWVEGRLPLERLQSQPQAQAGEQLKQDPQARQQVMAELGQVLQRQLDTLESRVLNVNAQAWPGQAAQWQIEREAAGERDADGGGEIPVWATRLNLELPALGALGARIRLVGHQVQLTLDAGDETTAALLATHRARLEDGMAAAGLALVALNIKQDA